MAHANVEDKQMLTPKRGVLSRPPNKKAFRSYGALLRTADALIGCSCLTTESKLNQAYIKQQLPVGYDASLFETRLWLIKLRIATVLLFR
jgi:hypothetical protein